MLLGYMRDAHRRLVALNLVKPEHLLEHSIVRSLHRRVTKLSVALRTYRDQAMAEIEAFLDLLNEKYSAQRGGRRGNLTLSSYDGTLRVQIAINDQLEFDPELAAAKALVDKKGKLNMGRTLALRRLSIDDAEWLTAMEAISDAVREETIKRYLRIYERRSPEDKFARTPMDLATV